MATKKTKSSAGPKWLWQNAVKRLCTPKRNYVRAVEAWKKACQDRLSKREDAESTLSLYGDCLQCRGIYRVGTGDASGWIDLHDGWRCNAWCDQSRTVESRARDTESVISDATWVVMQAICWDEMKFAQWYGDKLLKQYQRVGGVWWSQAKIFAMQLFFLWRGKTGEEAFDYDAGPYNAVIDHWSKPAALRSALVDICDFHCASARFLGRCEFSKHPYLLVPFEVEMIYRVRDSLGLETPQFSHPLRDNPLGRIPHLPPLAENPLLEAVIKQARKLRPKVPGLKQVYWRTASKQDKASKTK